MSNYESDKDEDYDIFPYKILVDRPDPNNPTSKYLDTMNTIDRNKSLPIWKEILRNFEEDSFPYIISLSHLDKRNFDDNVYANINKSKIHLVDERPLVFPYIEVIKWIISFLELEER